MAYHTNLRRAFSSWRRAVYVANAYGWQTGWKYRVRRVRSVWRIERTDRRAIRRTFRVRDRLTNGRPTC
jgi:hypothetical protein